MSTPSVDDSNHSQLGTTISTRLQSIAHRIAGDDGSSASSSKRSSMTNRAQHVGKLLRTKHIETLQVLARFERRNQLLEAENSELERQVRALSESSTAERVRELERKLGEAEARAAHHFVSAKQYEEVHARTADLVRQQRATLAKWRSVKTRLSLGAADDDLEGALQRHVDEAKQAVGDELAGAKRRVVELEALVKRLEKEVQLKTDRILMMEHSLGQAHDQAHDRHIETQQELNQLRKAGAESDRMVEQLKLRVQGLESDEAALREEQAELNEKVRSEQRRANLAEEKLASTESELAKLKKAKRKADMETHERIQELQATVHELEFKMLSEREATDREQRVAEREEEAEAAIAAAEAERRQYLQEQAMTHHHTPDERLLREKFPEYVQLMRVNESLVERVDSLEAELARLQRSQRSRAQAEAAVARADFHTERHNSTMPFIERATGRSYNIPELARSQPVPQPPRKPPVKRRSSRRRLSASKVPVMPQIHQAVEQRRQLANKRNSGISSNAAVKRVLTRIRGRS